MEPKNVLYIWEKSCAGQPKAQAELYRLFASKMYTICLRYAGNTGDADDILQTGFIRVFTKSDRYDGKGSLEGWIRRIMINSAIEHLRKNKQIFVSAEHLNDADKAKLISTDNDPTAYRDLMTIITSLPVGYRTVFNLYAIEGYTHKEIAEMLNISEGNSKSQLSRARSWLRERLKKMEEVESCKKTI